LLGALAALPILPGFRASSAQTETTTPFASWNDGPAKLAILNFISADTY
jgi:hypothetical protein